MKSFLITNQKCATPKGMCEVGTDKYTLCFDADMAHTVVTGEKSGTVYHLFGYTIQTDSTAQFTPLYSIEARELFIGRAGHRFMVGTMGLGNK